LVPLFTSPRAMPQPTVFFTVFSRTLARCFCRWPDARGTSRRPRHARGTSCRPGHAPGPGIENFWLG
jgi:hypothetical protein